MENQDLKQLNPKRKLGNRRNQLLKLSIKLSQSFYMSKLEQEKNEAGEHDQRWIPPSPDVWKINIDAAFWEKNLAGAWGFVVRDKWLKVPFGTGSESG